ncbi:MAG: restriction endonuclease [Paludibacteraceae bacterium]|nr:restriction endonuclease [Paludibacteraceae bacterium]
MDSITRIKEFIRDNFPDWTKVDFSTIDDNINFREDWSDLYKINNEEIILISYTNISITGTDRLKPQLRVFLDEYKKPFLYAKKHNLRFYLFSIFTKEDEMARGLDNFNPKEYIISIETNLDTEGSRRDLRSIYDYANEKLNGRKFLKCSHINYKADINQASFIYIGTPEAPEKETFENFINIFDSRPYLNSKIDISPIQRDVQPLSLEDTSYLPYLTALRTKPFMLLAGISGTGKSRIVKELAFMTCPNEEGYNNDKTTPGNYCLIEVKPNWHDSSELLGYYNALDGKYELTPFIRFVYRALQRTDVPFFVCLDEMNLAPVEQYFAEYLSVLETRTKDGEEIISAKLIKKEAFNGIDVAKQYKDKDIAIAQYLQENGLPLPSNLYIVGTVNMDDTTHQFSRKVIDRAFTIEMNGGKLEDMFKPENANALQYRDEVVSLNRLKSHFVNAKEVFKDGESDTLWTQYETKIKTDVPARLKAINDILKNTPFQVSYRVQNELILYLAYLIEEAGFPEDIEPYIGEATLAILMEKILPRIQGDDKLLGRGQNKDVFTELSEYVEQTLMTRKTTDEQTKLVEGSDLYRKVIDKLDQMHKRLENSYFANFF